MPISLIMGDMTTPSVAQASDTSVAASETSRGESRATAPTLTWSANRLRREGRPTRILAGSLHYFRVHPDQWRDRLQRLVDLGVNTVDTYVPWNFHQPHIDEEPDFTGWRDLPAFLRTARELGLDAIVRPGPYICAEWTNGGLPTWLTASGIPLRTADPRFLAAVDRWFGAVLPHIVPLQAAHGGPVIAVQVENEFGSYGDDTAYVVAVGELLRAHGITELLYTADGPTDLMLDAGTIPDTLAALTLGSKPGAARDLIRRRRADEPFFVAEFWNGWFDHWGTPHHVRSTGSAASTLAGIIEDGGSVSIYMAHGGTNFGLWSGANRVEGELRATTTSYDSDAPIAEDGTLTPKFFALREVLGATAPVQSAQPEFLTPRTLGVQNGADVLSALTEDRSAQHVGATSSFEDLGADDGFVRYDADVTLPDRDVRLVFERIADRAFVFVDGEPVGEVEECGDLVVRGRGARAAVTVVVENRGRVNYGSSIGERKGMLGPVLVDRRIVQHWRASVIDPAGIDLSAHGAVSPDSAPGGAATAGIATASLEIDGPVRDTHLAFPGWGTGLLWVNGFLLGRYSEAGPQVTQYVPAPLLREGSNRIVLLDLRRRATTVELRDAAELGPEEEYVEEF